MLSLVPQEEEEADLYYLAAMQYVESLGVVQGLPFLHKAGLMLPPSQRRAMAF